MTLNLASGPVCARVAPGDEAGTEGHADHGAGREADVWGCRVRRSFRYVPREHFALKSWNSWLRGLGARARGPMVMLLRLESQPSCLGISGLACSLVRNRPSLTRWAPFWNPTRSNTPGSWQCWPTTSGATRTPRGHFWAEGRGTNLRGKSPGVYIYTEAMGSTVSLQGH